MKMLSCKNLGDASCNFVAKGETDDEVINNMMDHVRNNHPEKLKDVSKGEMHGMLRNKIQEM